nr:reverse transcriptase domain-containing protein [Tanacetum cinerariifolium]
MGEPLSPDRLFDFLVDEPEPHPAYDFFAPGPLPGYAGNPNNNNGWIEADMPLLGELGVVADEPMAGPIVDEIVEPIVEMEEQMIAPVIDAKEDIAMLFGDYDFSDDDSEGVEEEEVWEVNEEWLMAPVTPPLVLAVQPPNIYEVEGPSTAAAEGPSFPLLAPGLPVPPSVIEDLSTRLGSLEYGHGQLVKKVQVMASQMVRVADKFKQIDTQVEQGQLTAAMLLKKLPEKLGDPGKFLIPCDFSGMDVCHALADLGASINLMLLSIWRKLSLPELTPTRMTLELADRSITRPKGVAEDVFVKVGKFYFPTDFVVVDFEADHRVPLILGRSFLRTARALIDVYGEEITLRVNDEAVTFNLNQTMRYSSTYDDLSVNRIDIIDVAREEYAQEILGFSNNSLGGNPTSTSEPILFDSSPSLTPFEESDFILEEIDAYLKDESISPEIDHADCDPKGDICLIEKLLNNDPF